MRKTVSSQLFSKGWQLIAALALLIVLALTLSQVNSAAGQPAPTESGGIDRLVADTNGAVEISLNSATGVASFVRMPHDAALSTSSNGSASEAAGAFFQHYGDAFGIKDAGSELVLANSDANQLVGGVQLTYQQVYEEVPVFAAVLKARLSAQNQVTSVNGTFVPNIKLNSTTPTLSAGEAGQIAVNTVASQSAGASSRLSLDGFGNLDMDANASHDLAAVNSLLYVFRTGLVQGVAGRDHLVYEVEVTNSDISTREFVYVDAHTGAVVDQITGIFHGLDREVSEESSGQCCLG